MIYQRCGEKGKIHCSLLIVYTYSPLCAIHKHIQQIDSNSQQQVDCTTRLCVCGVDSPSMAKWTKRGKLKILFSPIISWLWIFIIFMDITCTNLIFILTFCSLLVIIYKKTDLFSMSWCKVHSLCSWASLLQRVWMAESKQVFSVCMNHMDQYPQEHSFTYESLHLIIKSDS